MRLYDGGYRKFLQRSSSKKLELGDLHRAIGGDYEAFGIIEREMLKFYGLKSTDRLVDVGCGAGRLVAALQGWFVGDYLGTDVVPRLLKAARQIDRRSTWKFVEVQGPTIPADAGSVDVVCMFSVLTHLFHEDSYTYLMEAHRVLRSGGRVVFSFLEFRNENHWRHFSQAVIDRQGPKKLPLTMFLSRDAIETWAKHIDLRVVEIRNGVDRFVPLPAPLTLESGVVMEELGCLGHAICVLEKRYNPKF